MADLNVQFQQYLGRPATPDELAYFNKFISEGNLDDHEIGQILQSTPEYQSAQLERNTTQFGDKLNAQNQGIIDMAGASANSRFASLGRPNTSAMGASVLQAGGQLAQQRQSALASFYGNGLQQTAALGAQQGMAATARGYGLRDETRQRGYQIEDYYRQKNDAASYEKSHSGWNAITPEFAISLAAKGAGQIAGGYAGGRAGAGKGLFSPTPFGG